MSSATIFCRLREADTSFAAIVEQVRREKAIEYLADTTISLSRVAELLGYSEHRPFFRALVRWFDCTPAEYRAGSVRRS